LPSRIRTRRDKIGFATPETRWFLFDLVPQIETLLMSDFRSARYINQERLLRLFRRIRGKSSTSRSHVQFLWRCINLELWMRQFFAS